MNVMLSASAADKAPMARSQLFTNHMHVLRVIAQQPDVRLREIAREVGITERATHRIVSDLVDDGYVTRTRVGSRNRYETQPGIALRDPQHVEYNRGEVLRLFAVSDEQAEPNHQPAPGGRPADTLLSSELFREAFTTVPAGMMIADATGRIVAANPAYCTIVKAREHELLGRNLREFHHPDDIAEDDERLNKLAGGQRLEYERERRYVRRDGTIIWVKLRIAVGKDPMTQSPLFVADVVDISERIRQEQTLREAEERFRSAFDNAPIGLALVAPDGRWLKVNRSLLEITGYTETALLIRSFQSITHPDDLDADLEHLNELLTGRRRTYHGEKRYYHADGHIIWVMLSISLVRNEAGDPLYFVSQIEDITERKQREALQH